MSKRRYIGRPITAYGLLVRRPSGVETVALAPLITASAGTQ